MLCNDMIPSEEEIRRGVLRELQNESRIKDAIIAVSVMDGTVKLTGAAASQSQMLVALEAARRAEGVFDVVNQIRVKSVGVRPSDNEIAAKIRSAIESGLTNKRTIEVAVSNGWVALHGRVERKREIEEAGRIARAADGVRGVYNLINQGQPMRRRGSNAATANI